MATDLAPFAGTVGGGFLIGFITGYAVKKVIKIAAIIVGLFIAAMSYFQYQRIINVDWEKVQAFSQNGITWVVDYKRTRTNLEKTHIYFFCCKHFNVQTTIVRDNGGNNVDSIRDSCAVHWQSNGTRGCRSYYKASRLSQASNSSCCS
ncbi:MAG: FUN14 domain-containing protein [Candidatus Nitrosopolaris sp.]